MDFIVVNGEAIDVVGTKLDLLAACSKISQKDLQTIIKHLKYQEKIDTLNLSHNHFGKHSWHAIEKIIESGSNLKSLDLSHNSLELSEHWNSISSALRGLDFLTELDLSTNAIDSLGMSALVNALQKSNSLKKLSMKYFKFTEDTIEGLSQLMQYNQNITHLDLFGGSLNGTLGLLPLVQALSKNRTVTYLDLSCHLKRNVHENRADLYELIGSISSLQTLILESNAMNDHELEALLYTLLRYRADIRTLNLSENNIQMTKTRSLTTFIEECPSLTDLNINHNKIDQEAMLSLLEQSISRSRIKRLSIQSLSIKMLSDKFTLFKDNSSLTDLCLNGYNFNYAPDAFIHNFIGLKKLTKLSLSSCNLKEKMEFIVESLVDYPIEELDLSYNFMNYHGIKAVPNLIQRTKTLKKLNLARNLISDGFPAIFAALSVNNTITELDISNNSLSRDGSLALRNALTTNTNLKILLAESTGFDIQSIKEIIKTNRSLTKMDLKFNGHVDNDYNLLVEALKSNVTLIDIKWMYGPGLNIERGQTVIRVFPSMMNVGEKILFENKRRKLQASAVLIIAQTILWSSDQSLFASLPLEVLEQILVHCSCQYFTKKQIGVICAFAINISLPIDCYTLCKALM